MAQAAQYAEWLQNNQDKKDSELYARALDAYKTARTGELKSVEAKTAPTPEQFDNTDRASRFARGLADPVNGLAQIGYNVAPESVRNIITNADQYLYDKTEGVLGTNQAFPEAMKADESQFQKDRAATGQTGIDAYRLSGNIASTIPIAIATKGKAPTTLLGRSAAGAAIGGATAATNPVYNDEDFWGEKGKQAALGAALGAAFPPVADFLKWSGRQAVEFARPWTKSGIVKDVNKYVQDLTGDQKQKVLDALIKAKEYVSGSKPTSGQAIAQGNLADPENVFGSNIVKLEQDLSRKAITGDILKTTYKKQEAARGGVLSKMAGTEDDMAVAIKVRSDATAPLYKAVEESKSSVQAKPVFDYIDDVLKKNSNETAITRPLNQIRSKLVKSTQDELDNLERIPAILKQQSDDAIWQGAHPNDIPKNLRPIEDGLNVDFLGKPQALASLSKEIKSMIGKKTPDGRNQFDVKVLTEIKSKLDEQIGYAEKSYSSARELYKTHSTPINKMQVARAMQDKLSNPSGKEAPGAYLKALDESQKTLKKATGFPRYGSLKEAVGPEQAKNYTDIAADFERSSQAQRMASATEGVGKTIPGEVEPLLPPMLSRGATISNAILKKIAKDVTPEYEAQITKILLDPKQYQKILEMPTSNPERQAILDALGKVTAIISSQQAGRQAGEQ